MLRNMEFTHQNSLFCKNDCNVPFFNRIVDDVVEVINLFVYVGTCIFDMLIIALIQIHI